MATKRKRTIACDICKERKVKCNGEIPCTNCLDRDEKCFVSEKKQTRRLHADGEDPLAARLSRIEALLNERPGRSSQNGDVPQEMSINQPRKPSKSAQVVAWRPQQEAERSRRSSPRVEPVNSVPEPPPPAYEDGSVYSAETSNLEYVGPRTFLSICSTPAISWISSRLGSNDFQPIAARLLRDITQRLKPSPSLHLERKPDPLPEDAWRYTESYFSEAPEAAFGILNRTRFESAIRKHYEGSQTMDNDPAWYALRNIVFAYGSRILLSRTLTFEEANKESQGWFLNALAVHTDILYFRTSIVGVLALIVMAYYTEGLGGPSLQHMLVACAVRLACAKGLHRQPCPSWKLHPDEASHRSWVFWAIYCLDKHISLRSGRPSAVDDDEISCVIPTSSPTSNPANVWYCSMMVKMGKFLSRIGKDVSSATAMGQNPETTLFRVRELDGELQAFADLAKGVMDLKRPFSPPPMAGSTPEQALRVQLMYFEVVFALHSTISRPWLRLVCPKQAENSSYQDQILYSAEIAASASRSVILACAQMHLTAQCSHWTALTVPLTACINLFLRIVQDPGRATTQSDLSLLDVGAGHFARLDFATQGALSHSFVRECAQLARSMASRAPTGEKASSRPTEDRSIKEALQATPTSKFAQPLFDLSEDFDLDAWLNMEMWLPIEY